ncbi:Leucine Rich repeat-containing protein [Candidatus Cyrtobacter comes]|uniref:Leucine Rich repeat-containing protein n=1 Tax=Candidatus Cyrtobacter comes TaxID=675776 RepID=A0ABU5L890_9RICK|nr:leucine-rich repeat domain-containing protein [Candidatus Cyrtobacter comes]MDZ5762262.1 Leucine Rich repeat-containing protein [Candidatus Cyrtobacter comes]
MKNITSIITDFANHQLGSNFNDDSFDINYFLSDRIYDANLRLDRGTLKVYYSGFAVFIQALARGAFSEVTFLDLSNIFLRDEELRWFAVALNNGALSGLISLNLSNNQINDGGLRYLSYSLMKGALSELECLDLSNNCITTNLRIYLEEVSEIRNLFGLESSNLENTGFGHFIAALKYGCLSKLKSFNFSNSVVDDSVLQGLIEAVQYGVFPVLESLYMNDCLHKVSIVERFANSLKYLPILKSLHISSNFIGDEGLEYLVNAAKCYYLIMLEYIDLSSNTITAEGMRSLAHALNDDYLSNLQFLKLNDNLIGDSGLKYCAKYLGELSIASYLNISSNQLGDDALAHFAKLLKKGRLSEIQTLDLSGNVIGDIGLEYIANSAIYDGTLRWLRDLDLSHNRITDIGPLVEALRAGCMPNLEFINLGFNYVDIPELWQLAEYLLANRRQMEVRINSYQFEDPLTNLLEINPYILITASGLTEYTRLLLDKNSSQEMLLYNKILGNIYNRWNGDLNDPYYVSYTGDDPDIDGVYLHFSKDHPVLPSENLIWRENIFPILGIKKHSGFETPNGQLISTEIISIIAQFLDPLEMMHARINETSNKSMADRGWYSEDDISILLSTYLSTDRYSVIAQTQIEDNDLLTENINMALETVLNGRVAIMPIHVSGNHWVAAMFRPLDGGAVQVLYIDSLGMVSRGARANFVSFESAVEGARDIVDNLEIINLSHVQQLNGYDCARFAVANMLKLADLEDQLNNLQDHQGINRIIHMLPDQRDVDNIREQYSHVIAHAEEHRAQLSSRTDPNLTNDMNENVMELVHDMSILTVVGEVGEVSSTYSYVLHNNIHNSYDNL